jgi:hypothetical protein
LQLLLPIPSVAKSHQFSLFLHVSFSPLKFQQIPLQQAIESGLELHIKNCFTKNTATQNSVMNSTRKNIKEPAVGKKNHKKISKKKA